MARPLRTVSVLPMLIVTLCKLIAGAPAEDPKSPGNSTTLSSNPLITNSSSGSSPSANFSEIKPGPEKISVPLPSEPVDYYKTKYDHIDVEAILNNKRMVKYYTRCLLGQGTCSPDGAEFKRILPDAIRTNCKRCTEKQKAVTIRVIKRLMKEYPKIWAQLAQSWDPKDVYVKKFLETYANWEYKPPATTPPSFLNRFEDEEEEDIKPTKNDILPNIPPLPAIPPKVFDTVEPFANNIGAGLTATVRIGNRVVGGVIRQIDAVRSRVVETGTKIADVLLRGLRPL